MNAGRAAPSRTATSGWCCGTFDLDDIAEAHRAAEKGNGLGKVAVI
jgi:hypothetical protein